MSDETQVRLIVYPLPHLIAWEMRDGSRRLGHGHVDSGDWVAMRGVEVRSGVAHTELSGAFIAADAIAAAAQYGWRLPTSTPASA